MLHLHHPRALLFAGRNLAVQPSHPLGRFTLSDSGRIHQPFDPCEYPALPTHRRDPRNQYIWYETMINGLIAIPTSQAKP